MALKSSGCCPSCATLTPSFDIHPTHTCCQMDTSFRLGWSGAHNIIHFREITEMLQATPQCCGPWVVTAATAHKAAELCDPAHRLVQRGGLGRRGVTVMDGAIQSLPF